MKLVVTFWSVKPFYLLFIFVMASMLYGWRNVLEVKVWFKVYDFIHEWL